MEFWVVAAATGAGYVAKHWQNISGEKDGSSTIPVVLSPRTQPDQCHLFGKLPVSGSAPICIEKQVLQDNNEEINGKQEYFDTFGHGSYELRTKKSKRKSFSSLRPLVVASNRDSQRKQPTKVDDLKDRKIMFMEENGAFMETEICKPSGLVKLPREPELINQSFVFDTGNDMVPLFLGITIGILSTTVTNQREVEHLNELLEQAEYMVQDLHRKLEIKDEITTKKCGTEAEGTATDSPKANNYELTSDIEAELEAELERLEENMKSCTLQRLSNVVEIDSDFEADMAKGDINLDALTWQLDSQYESDNGGKRDKSESTGKPVFTPNYAVSSLDLRLRLHEVIELELRARIEELEAVLQNQKRESKPHSPESQDENSFWDFDHMRIESFSSTP